MKGFDRKGVQFFRFTTPITEDITRLEVVNSLLFVFTDYSVTSFEETMEKSFYMAPERINCATIMPLLPSGGWSAVVGCQDRCIRLLNAQQVLQVCRLLVFCCQDFLCFSQATVISACLEMDTFSQGLESGPRQACYNQYRVF